MTFCAMVEYEEKGEEAWVERGGVGCDRVADVTAGEFATDEGTLRSTSLSVRKRSLFILKIWTPVEASSRTVETPSRMETRALVV